MQLGAGRLKDFKVYLLFCRVYVFEFWHVFGVWSFQRLVEENHNVLDNLIVSEEAHFYRSELVAEQDTRVWGTGKPKNFHQRALHPRKRTVWCAVMYSKVFGLYFSNDGGVSGRITGAA